MPSSNLPANDFNAYGGLDGSAPLANNIQKKTAGNASPINNRYAYEPINEPSLLLGYAEVQFLLAEAAERGWINGKVQTFYKNGIEASLNFSNFKSTYSDGEIQSYLTQPSVALQAAKKFNKLLRRNI